MSFFSRLFGKSDKPLTDEEIAKAGRYPTFPIYCGHPNEIKAWFIDRKKAEAEVERRNRNLKAGEQPWQLNALDTLREVYAQGRIGAAEARALLDSGADLTRDERARAAKETVWTMWYEDRIDRDSSAFAVNHFLDAAQAAAAHKGAQAPHEDDPWQSYAITESGNLLEQYEKGHLPLEQVRRLLNQKS